MDEAATGKEKGDKLMRLEGKRRGGKMTKILIKTYTKERRSVYGTGV